MALVVKDRVQETSTTSGTGTLTLSGAVPGFQDFSTAIGNGNTTFYTIYDGTDFTWEVGIGTVGAGTLARTTVLSNSSGTTSPITLVGNTSSVFCTYPAEKSINYDADGVATIGEVLGYSDTGIIGSFASTVAGYNQVVVQNKSTATNASTNFNVSNDAGTSGSNYAELGINSSTFVGTGSFNIAGASYVASASTDLTLGTYGAYSIHFVTNSNTTDAMTIYNNGGVSLGTFGNPGIKNIAASKFVPGYTAVTSAAGTTVLTADSNYYQNLVGSTTQTFKLPDATTLLVGTTFIFDNNSSGALTVVDNASGPIETIPGGAASFVYLYNNSTVAGSWNTHSFLPASYDFNLTTANFGNAAITNAVWNGTTIATGYGGTGLTTFAAANNAIYSTSSSALAAGTLPIQAGGTAATTFTANGVLYGNGTSALGATAAGTTGQVLIGNTGAAPSWGTISSSLVSSFSAGSTGLTPNSATTGAITLAGTLGTGYGGTNLTSFTSGGALYATSTSALTTGTLPATSGGTGLSAYTTGDIIYASATNTLNKLADVATGNALISGGVTTAPSWGKIGLTTHVSGTLPTANGGTNLTSFTSGGALYATSTSALTTGTLPAASGGTSFSTYTTGDIIYASATNTLSKLGVGSNGQILTLASGVPSWAASTAATTRTTSTFTATAGQTTFTVSYTVGYIDVFRNGSKLAVTDYTATNGTSIVLNTGANVGDTVETVAYSALSLGTGVTSFSTGTTGLTPTSGSGAITLGGTLAVANGGTGVTTSTGTGNVVLSTSPTLVTPILGTPTSGTLTNCTGLSLTSGVTGTLPVANGGTGITSLGTGVATFLGTPSSSNLASAVTDETGSGSLVFGTSPTLNNPTLTNYTESVVSIGTVTTSNTLSLTNGTVQTATLTASTACTFTMPTATAGKSFILLLKQAAATGNGTATFTSVKWNSGGAPTITATAGKMDILSFVSDGTNWYGSYTQGYTP